MQLLVTRELIASVLSFKEVGDAGRPIFLLSMTGGLVLLAGVLAAVASEQQGLLSAMVDRYTNSLLLRRVAGIELARFETPEFHDLFRRATNALGQLIGVSGAAVSLARTGFLVLGVAIALYVLGPILLVVALGGFLLASIASMASSREMYAFARVVTPTERRRSYVFSLSTSRDMAKEVRAYGLANYLRRQFEHLSDERIGDLRASWRRRRRYQLFGASVSAGTTTLTYAVLGYLVVSGRVGVADAAAAMVAAQQLNSQLYGVLVNLTQLYEAGLYLDDWDEFQRITGPSEAVPQLAPSVFGQIDVEHVSFTYPGTSTNTTRGAALSDVSIRIGAGEIVALVGENGSGKTTLAKLLANLYQPDAGRIVWDGVDARSQPPGWVESRVAVLFQDFAKFMVTVRENIAFGRVESSPTAEVIVAAATAAGAHEFIATWPKGYESVLGPVFAGGRDVSVGQWQRIALARALLRNAPLVILDEPTAALDARAEHRLFSDIHRVFTSRAVLMISHRFANVRIANRIYVLKEGRIIEEGTHEQLLARGGLYAELYELQSAAFVSDARDKS